MRGRGKYNKIKAGSINVPLMHDLNFNNISLSTTKAMSSCCCFVFYGLSSTFPVLLSFLIHSFLLYNCLRLSVLNCAFLNNFIFFPLSFLLYLLFFLLPFLLFLFIDVLSTYVHLQRICTDCSMVFFFI